MKKICVYSGSNPGSRLEYRQDAKSLGAVLAQNHLELVYGGSNIGLMGEVANELLRHQGKVTGVIPQGLFDSRVIHQNLTQLIETKDMSERKKTMANLADAFIALPGGLGTFEELFEILSWAQLGLHHKPIGLLNTANFFDPLLTMLQKSSSAGFIQDRNLALLLVDTDPAGLIAQMKTRLNS